MKYVFVTGGPMSGIGKGIIASSIAMMLGWNNIPTTAIKIDGYLNYDADTMSPYEHGEAYVTADGGVSDLDLGNYERFVGLQLSRDNSITMGKIYAEVTKRERAGEYGGKTVQIVPHVTDAIKDWIRKVANSPAIINDQQVQPQVCIVEIGGTVGDMETLPVFHAIKQMIYEGLQYASEVKACGMYKDASEAAEAAFCFVHVSHLSYVGSSDGDREEKTKPTQHNIELLRSLGISPNLMVIRCEKKLSNDARSKLAAQCLVPHIIDSYNMNIHCVPEVLYQQNIVQIISQALELGINVVPIPDSYAKLIQYFRQLIKDDIPSNQPTLHLAIVGKYTGMNDTYLSLIRAIQHAAFAHDVNVIPEWIDAQEVYDYQRLGKYHGILVPGGFGSRGISGMLMASQYARRTNKPYFGICLGMQVMISEFALEIFEGSDAICPHSSEWCNCNKKHTIQLLPGQEGKQSGATMRLGNFSCHIENGTIAHQCYQTSDIVERHRHRYEVNNELVGHLEDNGLIFSGTHRSNDYGTLCEIAEFSDKKFHVGCQFHPEFLSRHWKPHPLFYGFISAMKSEFSN